MRRSENQSNRYVSVKGLFQSRCEGAPAIAGLKAIKPNPWRGVAKSFPRDFQKPKNSLFMFAPTVWDPESRVPV